MVQPHGALLFTHDRDGGDGPRNGALFLTAAPKHFVTALLRPLLVHACPSSMLSAA